MSFQFHQDLIIPVASGSQAYWRLLTSRLARTRSSRSGEHTPGGQSWAHYETSVKDDPISRVNKLFNFWCSINVILKKRCPQVGQNFFLSVWTDETTKKTAAHEIPDNRLYIAGYFVLGAVPIILPVPPPPPPPSFPSASLSLHHDAADVLPLRFYS